MAVSDHKKLEEEFQESIKDLLENAEPISEEEMEPFDGKFYIKGEDEPLVMSPKSTIGELEREVDRIAERQKKLAKVKEWIDEFTEGDHLLAADLLARESKRQQNRAKLKEFCPLRVKDNKIYVELPDKTLKKVSFGRGAVAKSLYIFYLRQIMRAEKDPKVSKYVSQIELEGYQDELLEIYRNVSGNGDYTVASIATWWKKGSDSNDFGNALASIRRAFVAIFDISDIRFESKRCYTIEIKGTDRLGNPRYGIDLKPGDFVLGKLFEEI